MDDYDVLGDLKKLCNNNVLDKLKLERTETVSFDDADDSILDLDAEVEALLPKKKSVRKAAQKKGKKKKNDVEIEEASAATISPTKQATENTESSPPAVARRTRSLARQIENNATESWETPTPKEQIAPQTQVGKRGRQRKNQNQPSSAVIHDPGIRGLLQTDPTITHILGQPVTVLDMLLQRGGRRRRGGRRSAETTSRRSQIAEMAARSTNVEYVDLISSPMPRVEGFISLDSDSEEDNIPLPLTNTLDTVVVTSSSSPLHDLSFDEENPEISIKIKWNCGNPEVFQLRKHQKFLEIFKKMAQREKIAMENVVFNIDTRIISPDDTPDSINYKVYQFINGRALSSRFVLEKTKKQRDTNKITLKIQSDLWPKRPLHVDILKTDKFKILYIKCSEELNMPYDNFKLSFDGDNLEFNATPSDFELEGGEAIDLRIKK